MRILKRFLTFIASRVFFFTVLSALFIIAFYLAMNTANCWVLISDGLDARAGVVLMGSDSGVLNSYFEDKFILNDDVLLTVRNDMSPYRDYEIRGYVMSNAPSFHEYRFNEVPFMNNIAAYLEDNIMIPIGNTRLNLIAGIRNDNTIIKVLDIW